jgi:hypothetical protein
MSASTTSATRIEPAEITPTLLAAFAADPVIRWLYPDEEAYQRAMTEVVRLSAGAAFDAGTVDIAAGGAAVAIWDPPGTDRDPEEASAAWAAHFQAHVDPERLVDVFAWGSRSATSTRPNATGTWQRSGSPPTTKGAGTARRCCVQGWNGVTVTVCPPTSSRATRATGRSTSGTASRSSVRSGPRTPRRPGRCSAPRAPSTRDSAVLPRRTDAGKPRRRDRAAASPRRLAAASIVLLWGGVLVIAQVER